ncbi:hypothetical protein Q73_09375 [Bacillus coahuilensis m2-6]|uniref:5-formyltetrahydrofolate cyclo-ligase n=2 Tax=Bacillus coahuilensis TaxID=408580 RepID=A0A147K7U7_9BACI|nr:hypothetical protein Q75_09960 [Bacillus coahuilensis p1.1.43]KUP07432.1 hypothetical protein Q73_09375 [Bacillus coahuilensis m2-6]
MKHISEVQRSQWNKEMIHLFRDSDIYQQATTIGITISRNNEWNTRSLIPFLWNDGKKVVAPVCLTETKQMEFYRIHSFDQLHNTYLDLVEPNPFVTEKMDSETIDLLIVPGVVFNSEGYRIGFGGGYYDRFLNIHSPVTLSFAYSVQLNEEIPVEPHDQPVQFLITEKGLLSCTKTT